MQLVSLIAALLFTCSITLAVSDAARAAAPPQRTERSAPSGWQTGEIPPPDATIAYGADPLQEIDFYRAEITVPGPAPLVLFVHGGGWKRGDKAMNHHSNKAEFFPAKGYNYASINYRLLPDAPVEEQARDVAAALRALLDRADALGIDKSRVVLMGHSAGAHLVALVGTDPAYLRGAGLSMSDVLGVVPLDGAAYDVPNQMGENPLVMGRTYREAFGTERSRQIALSPTHQAARPNAANFLILYVGRKDGIEQSEALGKALQAAGTRVDYGRFPGKGLRGHATINREMGNPDYDATKQVEQWLERLFDR